jgi:hypothetical protein
MPRGGQKRGGERGPWAHFMNLIVHFMNVIVLPDFIQLLYNKRKHSTKNEYFSKHIQFTTIYLLQKQKLNHNKIFGQE